MSSNKNRDALVDFLMTAAFVALMLFVVKMSDKRHKAHETNVPEQQEIIKDGLDCIPKD